MSTTEEAAHVEYLKSVPALSRGIIARALDGTAAPRMAIKAKCLDCCHYDRAEVAACIVILCPLHPCRPFQNARKRSAAASVSEPQQGSGVGGTQIPPGSKKSRNLPLSANGEAAP